MDSNKQPDSHEESVQLAAATLGRDLLEALLLELKGMTKPWGECNQSQQAQIIATLRDKVRHFVETGLDVLFAGHHPACVGELGNVSTGKGGIKVSLQMPKSAPARHKLLDATGQNVVLVIADSERYFRGLDSVRAKADQGELFEGASDEVTHAADEAWELEQKPEAGGDDTVDPDPQPVDLGELLGTMEECGVDMDVREGEDGQLASIAEGWTEQQRLDAMLWAIAFLKGQATAEQRPAHVPEPKAKGKRKGRKGGKKS